MNVFAILSVSICNKFINIKPAITITLLITNYSEFIAGPQTKRQYMKEFRLGSSRMSFNQIIIM
jgi:hypothetical protein